MITIKKDEEFQFNLGIDYSTKTLVALQDINMMELLARFNIDIIQKRSYLYLDDVDIDLYDYIDERNGTNIDKVEKHCFKQIQFLLWLVHNSFVENKNENVRQLELFNPINSNLSRLPFEAQESGLSVLDFNSDNNEQPIAFSEPLLLSVVTDKKNKKPLAIDRAYPEDLEYLLEPEENQKIMRVTVLNAIYHDTGDSGYFTIPDDITPKKEKKPQTPTI